MAEKQEIQKHEGSELQIVPKEVLDAVRQRHEELKKQITPSEYRKLKPLGKTTVTYVPATYMDAKFKDFAPYYANRFAFPPFVFQNWVIVGVEVEDRLTKNTELGLKAHRIQFSAEKKKAVTGYWENNTYYPPTMDIGQLTPFDMIDVGNDVSSALTEAIKNAQSRFGVAADVYEKNILSDEDLKQLEIDFIDFLTTIQNPVSKSKYRQEWKECKTASEKLMYLKQLTGDN